MRSITAVRAGFAAGREVGTDDQPPTTLRDNRRLDATRQNQECRAGEDDDPRGHHSFGPTSRHTRWINNLTPRAAGVKDGFHAGSTRGDSEGRWQAGPQVD